MPEPIEELFVSIGADTSKLLKDTKKGVDQAESRLSKFGNRGKKTFASIGRGIKKTTSLFAVMGVAIVGVISLVNKLTEAYIVQRKAEAQLDATLRSTNNAVGIQSDELKKLASDLQNVTNIGDEVILTAEAMLLTFTNIGEKVFPRTTEAVLDVATAMNSGATPGAEQLRTVAIQLGRALNDPIKGLASLSRVGIQFTEQQKDQIKTLVDSGKVVEAQTVILGELEKQFGGSARAAREADGGFEAAANTIGDLQEQIGGELIPLREGYIEFLKLLASEGETSSGVITNVMAGLAAAAILVGVVIVKWVDLMIAQFAVFTAGAIAAFNLENPIAATADALVEAGKQYGEFFGTIAKAGDITSQAFNDIKKGWEEQREAAEKPLEGKGVPIFAPIIDEAEEGQEEIEKILRDAGLDFIDLQAETNAELEANQIEHTDTMAEIEAEGAEERLEVNEKFDKELVDSQKDITERAKEDLKRLEEDTDRDLEKRRKDTNRDEMRQTEDHLTDMRRLRLSFLDDLEDAVKSRDAGRVRDLQRQFQRESQERQSDFEKNQGREQSDAQQEINETVRNEERRAQEIIDKRTKALETVQTRIEENRTKELADLDEKLAAESEKENARFLERQTELENALNMRLETLAKELSDMEDLESESAQRILETLNETFGAGGNIDKLMNDFASRRKQTLVLEVGFEQRTKAAKKAAGVSGVAGIAGGGGSIPSFAEGGTLVANKPTLAMFGEAGPEVAQFMPISKLGSMGGSQKMEIDLKLSGSAPPGVRSGDRDAIAGVLVNALRESGINVKPGR